MDNSTGRTEVADAGLRQQGACRVAVPGVAGGPVRRPTVVMARVLLKRPTATPAQRVWIRFGSIDDCLGCLLAVRSATVGRLHAAVGFPRR